MRKNLTEGNIRPHDDVVVEKMNSFKIGSPVMESAGMFCCVEGLNIEEKREFNDFQKNVVNRKFSVERGEHVILVFFTKTDFVILSIFLIFYYKFKWFLGIVPKITITKLGIIYPKKNSVLLI